MIQENRTPYPMITSFNLILDYTHAVKFVYISSPLRDRSVYSTEIRHHISYSSHHCWTHILLVQRR